jgi:hypothetical protein
MCTEGSVYARLRLVSEARETADELLERYLRVPVSKAMNLGNARGFDRAVSGLAAQLRARASLADDAAVRAAVAVLDIDWGNTTAEQRRTFIARALDVAGRRTATVPGAVQAVFGDAADDVVRAARSAARQGQRLAISADCNALDHRIVDYLATSQSAFIRDEYGRRAEAFSAQARRIVSGGLESGLGRQDISHDLARAAASTIAGRGQPYWEVVAGSFIAQGRSFSQLSSFAEAGIDRYVFEAVQDEHTTETCRFLHGRIFSVDSGLRRFDQVEAEPDRVKDLLPWVRESVDADTGRKSLYVEQAGQRTVIAEVARSAVGTRDDRGEFSRGLGERELSDLGVAFPPLHGLCRSVLLGIV